MVRRDSGNDRRSCRNHRDHGIGHRFYWFIDLVAPHLTHLITGPDHRILIPGSLFCGAFLLLCADTISRTWLGELPVRVFTAFFGALFFLFFIRMREEL